MNQKILMILLIAGFAGIGLTFGLKSLLFAGSLTLFAVAIWGTVAFLTFGNRKQLTQAEPSSWWSVAATGVIASLLMGLFFFLG
jgi:hypothetical protein